MDFEDLTPEQKDKIKDCKTPQELLLLAKEEGYELSDEELEGVTGGSIWKTCDSPYHCNADGGCYGRTR